MKTVEKDLCQCISKFHIRWLNKSLKWASDLLISITKDNHRRECELNLQNLDTSAQEYGRMMMATSLLNMGEYMRASYYLKDSVTPEGRFVHFYAEYLELEKRDWEEDSRSMESSMTVKPQRVKKCEMLLQALCSSGYEDSYITYLKGLLYKRLDNVDSATKCMLEAITSDHLNWPAWSELSQLVTSLEAYEGVLKKLPNSWIKSFFVVEAELFLGVNSEKKASLEHLVDLGLSESVYLKSKLALLFKSMDLIDKSKSTFEEIASCDPFCTDNIDTYSNILYLQQDLAGLSRLVRHAVSFSKYRPETCFAVGNLYNAANLHVEAATYFQQALYLNPKFTHAWTLLGHEFVELRNIPSALASYRKAIELNPCEYRAWYGLGQAYELLDMPSQALSLYKKAYYLRPRDSKMSMAIARIHDLLHNKEECVEMLRITIENGDPEGAATIKLAGILESTDSTEASLLYKRYLQCYDDCGIGKAEESSTATAFLMSYYFDKGEIELSEIYARRGCRYNHSLKQSEITLKKIESKLADGSAKRKVPVVPIRRPIFSQPGNNEGSSGSEMDVASSP